MEWCKNESCNHPASLCSEMEQDVSQFNRLHSLYPDRFTLVRYEDLALDPERQAILLFKRLGLPFSPQRLGSFLRSHTSLHVDQGLETSLTENKVNPYSTKRDSRSTALEWTRRLSEEDIDFVQKHCFLVMKKLGYKLLPSDWNPGDDEQKQESISFNRQKRHQQHRRPKSYQKQYSRHKFDPGNVITDLPLSRTHS